MAGDETLSLAKFETIAVDRAPTSFQGASIHTTGDGAAVGSRR